MDPGQLHILPIKHTQLRYSSQYYGQYTESKAFFWIDRKRLIFHGRISGCLLEASTQYLLISHMYFILFSVFNLKVTIRILLFPSIQKDLTLYLRALSVMF